MYDLGTIGAAITLDNNQYVNKLKSSENQTFAMMKKIAGYAAVYLSTRKIFGFIYDSINLFSDLQETANKFDVVFGNVTNKAKAAADELIEYYGHTERTAKQLMGDTGDILTGFGFDQEVALKLSSQVAKMGTDLASFTNYHGGAEGAVSALTKLMLGETEQAKSLGIVVRQGSDEYKDLVKNIMKTQGVSLLQAKALAGLEMATKQSKNALGDYGRTQGELANQMREFDKLWKAVKEAAGGLVSELFNVKGGYQDINAVLKKTTAYIKQNTAEWIFAAKSIWLEIETGVQTIWAFIEPLASYLTDGFITGIENIGIAWQNGMKIGQWYFENIGKLAANFVNIAVAVGKDIWNAVSSVPGMIFDSFVAMGEGIYELFSKIGKNIWKVLTGKMSLEEAFTDSIAGASKSFEKTVDNIVNKNAKAFGELGKHTDKALSDAGVSAMPKMGAFKQAAGPQEVIDKYMNIGNTLDDIFLKKRKKQLQLEQDFARKMEEKNRKSKDTGGKDGKDDKSLSEKMNTFGSFNAAILELMGGGSSSPAERTAKATEKQVKVLKKVEKNTKSGGIKLAYT